MKVRDIIKAVDGRVICGDDLDKDLTTGCSSDLMSDILTLEPVNAVLITGLANIQAVRTADMAGISHILFVRDKLISKEMITLAEESGITLLETGLSMFVVCGKLAAEGLCGPY
ncbi:hypothetical protein [Spirochaeta isovalerica]|uniref:DRTGG domain-containing protein n=1 Tax=Spirochaeta isovalerica TaxID=150 RepID=A0A841RDV5_9SPIO|nr:hypothetical protein [Spirochaeta isovalerica]MBB6481029.1 hypothetical protein [Spirochaeta isovalerica]